METWIVDLTRAWSDSADAVLSALLEQRKPAAEVKIVAWTLSDVYLSGSAPQLEVRAFPAELPEPKIVSEIMSAAVAACAESYQVVVFSFRRTLEHLANFAGSSFGAEIRYEPLQRYSTVGPRRRIQWDESFMSRVEAVDTVVQAIGTSSTFTTNLRPRLIRLDSRFRKVKGAFTGRVGFIPALVQLATDIGYVETLGDEPGQQVALTKLGRERYAELRPGRTTEEAVTRAQHGEQGVQRSSLSRTPRRSDEFITVLRDRRCGPFQEVRLAVYEEMLRQVKNGECTVSSLVRDSVAVVRDKRSEDLLTRPDKPFPWDGVRAFIGDLLSRVPVLRSGARLVRYSWADAESPVTGFDEDWDLRLDGELVKILLEQDVRVGLDDLGDLAGALFNSRRDEFHERAFDVVQGLLRRGDVVESKANPGCIVLG